MTLHHGARVVVRDPEQTEMVVQGSGPARAFAKQLMKKGKAFRAEPKGDETWTFLIEEINWPTRWEDH